MKTFKVQSLVTMEIPAPSEEVAVAFAQSGISHSVAVSNCIKKSEFFVEPTSKILAINNQ